MAINDKICFAEYLEAGLVSISALGLYLPFPTWLSLCL